LNVAGIREQFNYLFPEFPAMAGKRMLFEREATAGKIPARLWMACAQQAGKSSL